MSKEKTENQEVEDIKQGEETSAENEQTSAEESSVENEESTDGTEAIEEDPMVQKDQEIGELKDKYLRLYSEFENFRRRTSKEKIELIATANEQLMLALLPVLDDFHRAQASFEDAQDLQAVKEGITLIYDKFQKTLEQKGLKPIEAKGEVFDSELHEGITQMPAPEEELKGKVLEEVEKGYYLGEKVIRYSKVVIGA